MRINFSGRWQIRTSYRANRVNWSNGPKLISTSRPITVSTRRKTKKDLSLPSDHNKHFKTFLDLFLTSPIVFEIYYSKFNIEFNCDSRDSEKRIKMIIYCSNLDLFLSKNRCNGRQFHPIRERLFRNTPPLCIL